MFLVTRTSSVPATQLSPKKINPPRFPLPLMKKALAFPLRSFYCGFIIELSFGRYVTRSYRYSSIGGRLWHTCIHYIKFLFFSLFFF